MLCQNLNTIMIHGRVNDMDKIRIKNNKEGVISIPIVIVIFISMITIVGYINIIQKNYVFNEVRSIMDMAGVSALKSGVDETALRREEFIIDESFVRKEYKRLIGKSISENSLITSFKLGTNDIEIDIYNSKWGLGSSTKSRPQARLEAIAKVRIKVNSTFDIESLTKKSYYDSFKNKNFTITYAGKTNDGEIELIVRSVTRIVYR